MTPEEVYQEFQIDPLPGKILVAEYYCESYEGYAYVLYQDEEGRLWEVEGSHCSCNGLEGQWSPGEVSWEYLRQRLAKTNEYEYAFGYVRADLTKLVNEHFYKEFPEDGTPV